VKERLSATYDYWVYGLKIHSNLELSALLPYCSNLHSSSAFNRDEHDVIVNFDPTIADFDQYGTPNLLYINLDIEKTVLFDRRVGLFILNQGKEVLIQPSAEQNLNQIRLYMLGTVLTVLMYQRGTLMLHGSAIQMGDQVIGVIAPSGGGKSSTAAALFRRGHTLLSDDAIAITLQDGIYSVNPGYPRLKISEEIADHLNCDDLEITDRHPLSEEVSFDARGQFADRTLPLKQIYVLGIGEDCGIEPLPTKESLFAVMMNSLPTMWLQHHSAEQFKQCTEFIKAIPFYQLNRSENLADMDDLMTLLENHALDRSNIEATERSAVGVS
jgi:hypothetical protein